jgi:hypothetical protein
MEYLKPHSILTSPYLEKGGKGPSSQMSGLGIGYVETVNFGFALEENGSIGGWLRTRVAAHWSALAGMNFGMDTVVASAPDYHEV